MRKCVKGRLFAWVIKVITIATAIELTFPMVTAMSTSKCPAKCHCSQRRVSCEHQNLQYIPKDIPSDTLYLYIGWNKITKIEASDFSSLVNLTTLSLKKNEIFEIHEGAFSANTKLKTLYLTDNILANVTRETFKGLSSLEYLYLTNNKLKTIPDLQYATLLKKFNIDTNKLKEATFPPGFKNLRYLGQVILTNNPSIQEIKTDTFANIKHAPITKVSLGRCGITKIEENSFAGLDSLQSVSVSYNPINSTAIQAFIQGFAGSTLHSLDMNGVFQTMEHLPSGTFSILKEVPLFKLSLAHSDITALEGSCFEGLSRLTLLDLSYVKIAAIEQEAFSGLNSLKELKLFHNRLTSIPDNLPPSLEKIDISHNRDITELPNLKFINLRKLKELRIHHCSIVQVHDKSLYGIENLEVLDLSYNQLGGNNIGIQVMQDLQQLTQLYLQGNKLRTINKESKLFVGLSNLILLDMSDSECSILSDGLFHPLKKLQILKLQNNQLGRQLSEDTDGSTFEGLSNLKELYLENNGMISMPAALFKNLQLLEKLVLKNNQLYHWEPQLFQPLNKICTVDLSINQISVLNETSLLYVKPPMKLNLSSNPFNCGCDLVWFRNWLLVYNKTLLNLTSYTCKSPSKMEGQLLLDFAPHGIWMSCHWLKILYACIGGVFIMTTVSGAVLYRYRWKIMVRYYFTRQYFRQSSQGINDTDRLVRETPEYHAILSSHEADDTFVENFLLPNISVAMMELCEDAQGARHNILYMKFDMDYVGQPASVFAKLACPPISDKIIVILSEEYLEHRRTADFELGIARFLRMERGKQAIIIIFIGTPQIHAKMPTDIRMLLNDEQCVVWDKQWQDDPVNHRDAIEVFYERVRDLLDRPVPGVLSSNIQV